MEQNNIERILQSSKACENFQITSTGHHKQFNEEQEQIRTHDRLLQRDQSKLDTTRPTADSKQCVNEQGRVFRSAPALH